MLVFEEHCKSNTSFGKNKKKLNAFAKSEFSAETRNVKRWLVK